MKILKYILLSCSFCFLFVAHSQEKPKKQLKKKPVKLKKVDPEKSKIKQVKALPVPEEKKEKK